MLTWTVPSKKFFVNDETFIVYFSEYKIAVGTGIDYIDNGALESTDIYQECVRNWEESVNLINTGKLQIIEDYPIQTIVSSYDEGIVDWRVHPVKFKVTTSSNVIASVGGKFYNQDAPEQFYVSKYFYLLQDINEPIPSITNSELKPPFAMELLWGAIPDTEYLGWLPSIFNLDAIGGGRFKRQIVAVNNQGQIFFGE